MGNIESEGIGEDSVTGSKITIELEKELKHVAQNIPLVEHVNLAPPPVVKFSWLNSSLTSNVHHTTQLVSLKPVNSESINITKIVSNELKSNTLKRKKAVDEIRQLSKRGIHVVMGEKELNGKLRFLADGFAETHECQQLMLLAQSAAIQGDGYSGNKSPHTDNERFEGVSLGRAALLVYFGTIEPEVLELYINLSERGKNYVERYFQLKNKLYFTYTHLVCRTALSGATGNRTDLSHAVHADNCNLQENGDCTSEPPAYTWRDYSAILYLNENFDGGEFIFSSDMTAKNIQSTVHPKCGRLVGFSAGRENLHGVNGVQRGSRCALGLWFTFNQNYIEVERILAQEVLTQVQNQGRVSEYLYRELKKHVPFEPPTDISEIP